MSSVIVEHDGEVAIIRLNRPHAMNAINRELLDELVIALGSTQTAPVRILEGAGNGFCAGEDLKETLAPHTGSPEELREAFGLLQDVTRRLTFAAGPTIAAVHGAAVGAGAEIAIAADFIIAGPEARFRFPEVVLGHAPTGGATSRLTALVGLLAAKAFLLTGRWIGADDAKRCGLVSEIVDDPGLRARELATELAAFPRRSMASTKRAVELGAQPFQETVLRAEIDAASYCFAAQEAEESVEEFRNGGRR